MQLNIWKIKNNLEKLPWIKKASVERQLPSTLNISISERSPAAIWQNKGKVKLIDREGIVLESTNLEKFTNLLIIVGEDAPQYAERIISIIESEKDIAKHVSSAIRISERRWNIRTHSGIDIKLPEKSPEIAWQQLAEKNRKTVMW